MKIGIVKEIKVDEFVKQGFNFAGSNAMTTSFTSLFQGR